MKVREKLKVYEAYRVKKDKKGKEKMTTCIVSFKEALEKAKQERKMIEKIKR